MQICFAAYFIPKIYLQGMSHNTDIKSDRFYSSIFIYNDVRAFYSSKFIR